MMLFWGEGFLRQLVKLILLVMLVLFCWGWVSHVVLGRMTTSQYVHQMCTDFLQGIISKSEKANQTINRMINGVKAWGRPVIV